VMYLSFPSSDIGSFFLFFFFISSLQFSFIRHFGFQACYSFRLDVGDGKEVEVEECPRSKLQENSIKYLGPVCNFLLSA
jgi:hypothetical protein